MIGSCFLLPKISGSQYNYSCKDRLQELKFFFNEWMDNGKNAFLCSLMQFYFQVLVMQISTSFFTNILMQQLKKHIPHFESHFVYPYHDDCLKIYKYIKLFSIFSINVHAVTPDSYHYHHPSLQMISKSYNLLF